MVFCSGLPPWLCCFRGWWELFYLQQTRWTQRGPAWSHKNRSPKIVQFDAAMWFLCLMRESLHWLFCSVLGLPYRTGSIQEGSSLRWAYPVVPGGLQGESISEPCQPQWESSRHHLQVREGPRQISDSTAQRRGSTKINHERYSLTVFTKDTYCYFELKTISFEFALQSFYYRLFWTPAIANYFRFTWEFEIARFTGMHKIAVIIVCGDQLWCAINIRNEVFSSGKK